jgi:hypothetical protein
MIKVWMQTETSIVHYTIIIPTKCTRCLLLKAQDITICTSDVELHLRFRYREAGTASQSVV